MTSEQQLLECEEALRCAQAEADKWRGMVAEPLKTATGLASRAIQSLSWDEMFGLASRNVALGLDAVRFIEDVAHSGCAPACDLARDWLVQQSIWTEHAQ